MPGEVDYPKETTREPPIGLKSITTSPRGPSRLAADAAHPGQSQDGRLVGSGGHHLSRAETDGSTAAVSGRVALQPHSHQDQQGWRGFFQRPRRTDCCLQRMTTSRDMVCTASCPSIDSQLPVEQRQHQRSPTHTLAGLRPLFKICQLDVRDMDQIDLAPPFPAPDSRRIRQPSRCIASDIGRVPSWLGHVDSEAGANGGVVRTCWGAMLRPDRQRIRG